MRGETSSMPVPVDRRYILLGASNLTFGFPLIVNALTRSPGAHGRHRVKEREGGRGEEETKSRGDEGTRCSKAPPIPNGRSSLPASAIDDRGAVTADPPAVSTPVFSGPSAAVPPTAIPVEILAAHGHGRSYRGWSHVLVRGLPGIVHCGLWEELQQRRPAVSTWGLITDVGNDLIYGCTPDDLLSAVRTCWNRLLQAGANVCFVRPPTERLLQLSELRYRVTKKLFFPGPTPPWGQMKRYLIEVDDQLQEFARETETIVVTPETDWYGIDPIHIRRSRRPPAWEKILNSRQPEAIQVQRPGLTYGVRIWNTPSSERTLFGRSLRRNQPALTWPDGSTLSLF